MRPTEIAQLRDLPLFADVPDFALAELGDLTSTARFARGATVFYEGDAAEDALFVVSGRLEARVDTHPGYRKVGEIARGEVAGEQALFVRGSKRNATVVASSEVIALKIDPETLRRGARNEALIALENQLLGTLARRVRKTNQAIRLVWKERPLDDPDAFEDESPTLRQRLGGLLSSLGFGS